MAYDPGIFAQANRPTTALRDPNEVMGGALDVQNKLNAIRANIAQQAAGEAYQQSIGPDGTPDLNKLRTIIAQDPRTALAAQSAVTNAQSLTVSQQDVATKNLGLQNDALDSLSSLNGGAGPKYADVQQKLQQGLAQGWLQPHNAQMVLAGMPSGDDAASMATRLHMIQTLGQQLSSPQQRLENTGGSPGQVSNGQTLQPGMTGGRLGPNPGAFAPAGAGVPLYPSRDQLAGQVAGVDAQGNPVQETTADRLARQGRPDLAGPAGRLPPSLLPPGYTGRNTPPGAAPASAAPAGAAPAGGASAPAPASAAPAPPPAAPAAPSVASPREPLGSAEAGGQVQTGLSPQRQAALSTEGQQSSAAFQQIADAGTAAQARGATLDNMLSDTRQFSTGPLADRIAKLREVGGRFGIPVDTGATSAAESFNKLAANLASQQGAGSDARLGVAQAGNPHSDLSPEGVDLMLRQLRGNEDYLQARSRLAAAYPNVADRRGFESQVGSQLDPRTFQYDRMAPAQKATYFSNLGDASAKASFIAAHNRAAQLLGGGG